MTYILRTVDIAPYFIAGYILFSYTYNFMAPPLISQAYLAKKLRLSRATISLSLTGHPRIPIATRARVQVLAHKLGYKANRNAVLLINQRWARKTAPRLTNIAYIQPSDDGKDTYFPGLLKQTAALGYHLDIFHSWKFRSNNQVTQVLYSRGIQGIIVGQNNGKYEPYIPPLDSLAIIHCGLYLPVEISTLVRPDLDKGMRLCFEKVHSRGFRRIGLVLVKHPLAESDRILETSIWDLKRLHPDTVELLIIECLSLPRDRKSLKEWVDRHKLDAVIATSPTVDDMLHELGIHVPFASFYDPHRAHLDGVDLQFSAIGEMSINLLDTYLRQNLLGMQTVKKIFMVEPKWHDGSSLSRAGRCGQPYGWASYKK